MKFTKLEKIALAGALASFAVSEVGESLNSPDTHFAGAVSIAACAGYIIISQTIGYYKDLKKLNSEFREFKQNYEHKLKEDK